MEEKGDEVLLNKSHLAALRRKGIDFYREKLRG